MHIVGVENMIAQLMHSCMLAFTQYKHLSGLVDIMP